MSGVFVEDPWSRIVDVHWKKKPPDEFPPEPGTSYCGRYGFGLIVDSARNAVPHNEAHPPLVGTFYTDKPNVGPDGERYGNLAGILLNPVETLTATAGSTAQGALGMYLRDSAIEFTTYDLGQLLDSNGNRGGIHWRVPMAEGENSAGVPTVIKTYTFNAEWLNTRPVLPAELGLGMSHQYNRAFNKPKEPFFVLGDFNSGSATYVYDFKYEEWAKGYVVTAETQFDPSIGGPAMLWLMARQVGGTNWSAATNLQFPLLNPGDYYDWEIIAECQLMPNFTP